MRISLGPSVVRGNIDESITGLWTFANVLGLLTDVIGERTSAAGVTIDGLLVKDAGIPEAAVTAHEAALAILESQITPGTLLARVASPETVTGDWTFTKRIAGGDGIAFDTLALATTFAFIARVTGATFAEFAIQANGDMSWGTGAGARDTNLFRAAANILKTDDAFTVGGELQLDGDLRLRERSSTLGSDTDNYGTGAASVQLITASGAFAITGFDGPTSGRVLIVVNADSQAFTLNDQDAGSIAANRIITPTGLNLALIEFQCAILVYDSTDNRWRIVSTTLVT